MTSYSRQALLLGLTVTIIVVIGEWLGFFLTLERETMDTRFTHARWRDEPMSDEIRFVDIDDGAIESIGRWPWDRSLLAGVIDEIRRAGARTIVLDLLFEEAQSSWGNVDHDAALAAAIGAGPCVLSVRAGEIVPLDRVWQSPRGRKEFDDLLDALSRNILMQAVEVGHRNILTGHRYGRFRARPIEFRRAAAALAMRRLGDTVSDPTYEDFVRAVVGNDGNWLLKRSWEQYVSWRLLRHLLTGPPTEGNYRDRAPLPVFAGEAAMVGFVNVNFRRDPDGALRRVPAVQEAPGGSVLQLGLAAAVLHLGLDPRDVEVRPDGVQIGTVTIPLRHGQLRLAWPTTTGDWTGVLRRSEFDRETAGHLSIGPAALLPANRRTVAANREKLRERAEIILDREIAETDFPSRRLIREVDDMASFLRVSAQEVADQGDTLTPGDMSRLEFCDGWPKARDTYFAGARKVDRDTEHMARELADKLVFVGMTASGTAADTVRTPLGAATPGVLAHAAIADMVLSDRVIRPMPAWTGWVATLLLGLLCTGLAARLTPALATSLVAVVLCGHMGLAVWLFGSFGSALPLAAPLTAGVSSWAACTALVASLLQRDRRRITQRFRTRVSPQLVEYLLENPRAVSMKGEQREVTVMVLDLTGFTSVTETAEVATVVRVLNLCMGEFTKCITRNQGYVNKFLGDGLLAFWSAFREDPQQAMRACRSALECREVMGRLIRRDEFTDVPIKDVRIGLATGRVIVGDCGAPPLLHDYTVIGNDVNLAARLESANKLFATGILITESTREQLDAGAFTTRPIGRVIVVGQTVPVMVHELMPDDTEQELIDSTTGAVNAFLAGDHEASARAWKRILENGPSTLASFYLGAIADPASIVNGAIRLSEK